MKIGTVRELKQNFDDNVENLKLNLLVEVEPIDITFDAETFERKGEIICQECDEEFAEYRLHVNGQANVYTELCHECFCNQSK